MTRSHDTPILKVALDTPLRQAFDYLPPRGDGWAAVPGVRVEVPLGRRRAIGYVTAVTDRSQLPAAQLKAAYAVLDEKPLWDAPTLDLLGWAAAY